MATQADVDQAFADLASQVKQNEDAEASAATLLTGLKAQLDAALALANPTAIVAQVKAISAQIGTDKDTLSAAVTANTPAA